MIRLTLMLCLLLLTASTVHAFQSDSRPASNTPWEFDPPVLDFGLIPPRQAGTATFKVKNVSDRPLKILTMKPSCKCTTVENLNGTVIPPHDFVEVTSRIDPRDAGGEAKLKIKFAFEDHGSATLEMVAEFSRAVRAKPGYFRGMTETSGEYEVEAVDGRPFKILAVNGAAPEYLDYDPATEAPRTHYKLRWDVSAYDPDTCLDANGTRIRKWWLIETDHPGAPIIDIILRHRCNIMERSAGRNWRPAHHHEIVGAIKPGEPIEFDVDFKWAPGTVVRNTRIEGVLGVTGNATVELIGTSGAGESMRCRVRVTPATDQRGLFYETIRIFSGQHSVPVVVIASIRE